MVGSTQKKKKRKRPKRPCIWLVEALNAHTNEAISGMEHGAGTTHKKFGRDGQLHNFWELRFPQVKELNASRANAQLDFKIWRQFEGDRYPELAPMMIFQSRNKKTAQRALRRLPHGAAQSAASSS